MHRTYITTEAMTTTHVQVFNAMYFQAVGYPALNSTVASQEP